MEIEKIKSNIAHNLKAYRAILGLTQKDLAGLIGIKRSVLGAYEEQRCNPKLDVMLRITKLIGTNIETFIAYEVIFKLAKRK